VQAILKQGVYTYACGYISARTVHLEDRKCDEDVSLEKWVLRMKSGGGCLRIVFGGWPGCDQSSRYS